MYATVLLKKNPCSIFLNVKNRQNLSVVIQTIIVVTSTGRGNNSHVVLIGKGQEGGILPGVLGRQTLSILILVVVTWICTYIKVIDPNNLIDPMFMFIYVLYCMFVYLN